MANASLGMEHTCHCGEVFAGEGTVHGQPAGLWALLEHQAKAHPALTCRHWIGSDAKGRVCGAPVGGVLPFCEKHLAIEKRRAQKRLDKDRARAAFLEASWRSRNVPRLPQMRVQLEQAEAEYARRTASPVADRAAVGGSMHRSIVRAQSRSLSDSNVSRVVELQGVIEHLRADIARAERAV